MFVILSYDISSKKGKKVKQECDKYLKHIQKSLYEGEITEKKLGRLKSFLERTIVLDRDSVVIYYPHAFDGRFRENIGKAIRTDLTVL